VGQDAAPARIVLAPAENSAAQAKIREKLAQPVTLEFVEAPLSDVVDFLRDVTSGNIVLDRIRLEEVGVTPDTPVTILVRQIRLASALNHVLRGLGLAWMVKDDVLVITSAQVAAAQVTSRAYVARDLVQTQELGDWLALLARQLATAGDAGTRGTDPTIEYVPAVQSLVVTGTEATHDRVRRLIEQLRGPGGEDDLATVKMIKEKLRAPVTLEFVETPLSDVVDFLRDYTSVNILLDRPSLEEEGVTPDTPVTIHVEQISLQSALALLLRQLNLMARIEDECLVIRGASSRVAPGLHVYAVAKRLGDAEGLDAEAWRRLVAGLPAFQVQLRAPSNPANLKQPFKVGDDVTVRIGSHPDQGTVLELMDGKTRVRIPHAFGGNDQWVANDRITPAPVSDPALRGMVVEYSPTIGALVLLGPEALHREVENLIGLLAAAAAAK
jgi:hypothetical protein